MLGEIHGRLRQAEDVVKSIPANSIQWIELGRLVEGQADKQYAKEEVALPGATIVYVPTYRNFNRNDARLQES